MPMGADASSLTWARLVPLLFIAFLSWGAVFKINVATFQNISSSRKAMQGERNKQTEAFASEPRPSLLDARPVPLMAETGGIVLFYHVAKAGGTTIRNVLKSFGNVNLKARVNIVQALPDIKMWAKGYSRGKVLAIEIHDGVNPNMEEIAAMLDPIREEAESNGVPFFSFTTLREPLSYAISFYNYENMGASSRYDKGNYTEESFRQLTLPSPQCMFFARGELATTNLYPELGYNLTEEECTSTYEVMTRHIDWVGHMETMSSDILPLLTYMLSGDPSQSSVPSKPANVNKRKNQIDQSALTQATKDYVYSINKGDMLLRERSSQDYRMSMWTNMPKTSETN